VTWKACKKCHARNPLGATFCFSCEWPFQRPAPAPAQRTFSKTKTKKAMAVVVPAQSGVFATAAVGSGGAERAESGETDVSCGTCGRSMSATARFCPHCGARMGGGNTMVAIPKSSLINMANARAVLDSRHRLQVLDGKGKLRMTFLLNATEMLCGREQGTIIVDDPYVSPAHCVFRVHKDSMTVQDATSRNGVFVRIKSAVELPNGSLFRAGAQLLCFESTAKETPADRTFIITDDSKFIGPKPEEPAARVVEVMAGGEAGDVRRLRKSELIIGRAEGTMLFPDDGTLSARHCRVSLKENGRAVLEDLNSANGTFVRIRAEHPLQDGDELLVGTSRIRVEAF